MRYPSGVLECLVRLETSAGFGSGVLIGRDLVLTCAHVVSELHAKALKADANFAQRKGTAANFLGEFGQTVATAVLYDGIRSAAILRAVHDVEDLALLQLDKPMGRAVFPPPFALWGASGGSKTPTYAAYGFRGRGPYGFDLQSLALNPIGQTDVELGSSAPMFSGNAPPGMSGGPVIARGGSEFYLVGITVLGGLSAAHGRLISASVLKDFLEQHASEETRQSFGAAGQQFGAELRFENSISPLKGAWQWIRLGRPTAPREHPRRSLDYIASRPLLMSDIDALFDRHRSPAITYARSRHFAEFTAAEAREVMAKMVERLGLPVSLPIASRPGEALAPGNQRSLPIEFDSSMIDRDGFVTLSRDVAEWQVPEGVSPNEPRRLLQGDRDASEDYDRHFTVRDARALLRPRLSLPVWIDA